jgi:hypothetical protein
MIDQPITKSSLYGALSEQLKKVNLARKDVKEMEGKYADYHPILKNAKVLRDVEEKKALRLMFRYVGMREEES